MKLSVSTNKTKQVLDITDLVEREVSASGKKDGICTLFLTHTTAALTTADLDPGTDLDMVDAFDQLIPKLKYRHPHNPEHVPDHILASLIGPSLTVPVENSKLVLGTWQRIVLIELDGPRQREMCLNFVAGL